MDITAITQVLGCKRDKEWIARLAANFARTADLTQERDREIMEVLLQWKEYTTWLYGAALLASYCCLSAFPRDSVEYKILYHRYILGRKWERIADDMYYCDRHVKRIAKNALDRLRAL